MYGKAYHNLTYECTIGAGELYVVRKILFKLNIPSCAGLKVWQLIAASHKHFSSP